MATLPDYAELRCLSNFSFLRGASRPEELVERATQLGYSALAIADECSMAGVVRAHVAAKEHGLKLLIGSQFQVQCDGPLMLVVLACNLNGYGNLCQFITRLRRAAAKGTYHLGLQDIDAAELDDCVVLASPARSCTPQQLLDLARWLQGWAPSSRWTCRARRSRTPLMSAHCNAPSSTTASCCW